MADRVVDGAVGVPGMPTPINVSNCQSEALGQNYYNSKHSIVDRSSRYPRQDSMPRIAES